MTVLFVCLLLLVAAVGTVLALIVSAPPPMPAPRDVFGMAALKQRAPADLAEVQRYPARDGEALAVRVYPSSAATTLIFLHGSSSHGGGYHNLAATIAGGGVAQVVLPNLRGHYLSGLRRGDVDDFGQLEDDIADLIGWLRAQGTTGRIFLGGHSSGGGLAVRFAGGKHRALVAGFLLLSPVLPIAPSMRGSDAGGWACVHKRRMLGLMLANLVGQHGLDALPIIAFNKPVELRDGTETLSYSHRLNTAYHPRLRYQLDLAAMGAKTGILVGDEDQAVDGAKLRALVAKYVPRARLAILPGVDHFGICTDEAALAVVAGALGELAR